MRDTPRQCPRFCVPLEAMGEAGFMALQGSKTEKKELQDINDFFH